MPGHRRSQTLGVCYLVTSRLSKHIGTVPTGQMAAAWAHGVAEARERCMFYLVGYIVMPDHWHAAIVPKDKTISEVVAIIKSFSARKLNEMLGRSGPLWQRSFHRRSLQRRDSLGHALRYMHHNPVRAELVEQAGEWPWSSWHAYYAEAAFVPIDRI